MYVLNSFGLMGNPCNTSKKIGLTGDMYDPVLNEVWPLMQEKTFELVDLIQVSHMLPF